MSVDGLVYLQAFRDYTIQTLTRREKFPKTKIKKRNSTHDDMGRTKSSPVMEPEHLSIA
jgi:hypothetical protein